MEQSGICWNNENKFNFNFKANKFKTNLPYIFEIKAALKALKKTSCSLLCFATLSPARHPGIDSVCQLQIRS